MCESFITLSPNLTTLSQPESAYKKSPTEGEKKNRKKSFGGKVIRSGFEPETDCLEGSCSIQLSYLTKISKSACKGKTFLLNKKQHTPLYLTLFTLSSLLSKVLLSQSIQKTTKESSLEESTERLFFSS